MRIVKESMWGLTSQSFPNTFLSFLTRISVMKNILTYVLPVAMGLMISGCAQLEYAPTNAVPSATAINNLASAKAAVFGVYSEMQDGTLAFDGWLSNNQMFSDECIHTGTFPTRLEFGQLQVFPANTTMAAVFSDFYDIINEANNVIAALEAGGFDDVGLTPEVINSYLGEVRFIRAYTYWYLLQNWGTPPLVTTPTREVTNEALQIPNGSRSAVVDQIVSDLQFAEANLTTSGSTRATSLAATAMLARAYLTAEDYANALSKAEEVINSGAFALEGTYGNAFATTSSEAIFYLNFTTVDGNNNAFFYFPSAKGGRLSISPSASLINAFTADDLRFASSIDTATVPSEPHCIKYLDVAAGTDPLYFIRLGEMYLIAAEAAGHTGDFTKATDNLNTIRTRAGLADESVDASNFVDLILTEKWKELAFEGPQRLWDLRRNGLAESVLGPIGYDSGIDELWPFPQRDIDRNPNLTQNSGY